MNAIPLKKSLVGYILDVDLKYPDELHVLHNDYPLTPEKTCSSLWHVLKLLWKIAD